MFPKGRAIRLSIPPPPKTVRRTRCMAGLQLPQCPRGSCDAVGMAACWPVPLSPGYAIVVTSDSPWCVRVSGWRPRVIGARRYTTGGITMSGRSIAVIGSMLIALAAPVTAQTPAPADRDAWSNDRAKPSDRTPPATRQLPTKQPRIAPPARADDEFDPPESRGCQFRDNKLDLLV